MQVATVMKQQHTDDSQTLRTAISSWWDDELRDDDKALEALLADTDAVRAQTHDYDRIGRCVRGESLETRDLLGAINARLDELPDSDRPKADNKTDKVIPFPPRVMRQRRVWQGAMVASLFAAVVAVGLTLSSDGQQKNQGVAPMQASGPTPNDRAVMASLNGNEVPEGASPISLQTDLDPGNNLGGQTVTTSTAAGSALALPDWATGSTGRGTNPYVVTHYRLASPEFGTTGPEARAASFGRE